MGFGLEACFERVVFTRMVWSARMGEVTVVERGGAPREAAMKEGKSRIDVGRCMVNLGAKVPCLSLRGQVLLISPETIHPTGESSSSFNSTSTISRS